MGHLETIIDVAKHQEGYIANYQVNVSRQMFSHYESAAKLERIQRGIYRVTYFPISDEEQYIVARLWSHERAVVSHQSALALHELSDVLPRSVHVSYPTTEPLPKDVPKFVTLHRTNIPEQERQWYGTFQITTIQRTLLDLAAEALTLVCLSRLSTKLYRRTWYRRISNAR